MCWSVFTGSNKRCELINVETNARRALTASRRLLNNADSLGEGEKQGDQGRKNHGRRSKQSDSKMNKKSETTESGQQQEAFAVVFSNQTPDFPLTSLVVRIRFLIEHKPIMQFIPPYMSLALSITSNGLFDLHIRVINHMVCALMAHQSFGVLCKSAQSGPFIFDTRVSYCAGTLDLNRSLVHP
uniref:Uncharacterized protein n=1 Tax=Oryza sativa subsp. japonica TaxID=39947 RepID=Q6K250_ORYSJ|nr:hypothetical protein [Oryza sativa Japonica Group]BAD20108.1 hypothetical protein [Oryza sativa Japonica Group]